MNRRVEEYSILTAAFLDLLGFGMLIADIQLRVESLTPANWPKGLVIGALLASMFVVQILVSPAWGRLSDRIGRKPVIVGCTLLSALAMLIYGFAGSLWFILISRICSGLGAANVAVAQAFVSDRYDGDARTTALGRMSAATTAGLVVGPPIGGFLATAHVATAALPAQFLVGIVSATASVCGALFVAFALPNLPPTESRSPGSRGPIDLTLLREFPKIRPLVVIAMVAWFSLATLEGTFARLLKHMFGYGQREFGILFGYESLLAVLIPSLALGWFVSRIRSRPLLRMAYVLQGVGLALNPFAALIFSIPFVTLVLASTLYATGSGIANPTVNGMCSRHVPRERQGELFGIMQGTRSFGFVVGPLLGGVLFDWHPGVPYVLAGLVCILAASFVPKLPEEDAALQPST